MLLCCLMVRRSAVPVVTAIAGPKTPTRSGATRRAGYRLPRSRMPVRRRGSARDRTASIGRRPARGVLRHRHRHRGHAPVEAAAVRARRPGAAARRCAPAPSARPVTWARPAAPRPTGRSGRQRGVAAAGSPADPDQSPAVRLQRPRPLDGADGSGHPARAAHAARIGTAGPDGRPIVQRAVGRVRARPLPRHPGRAGSPTRAPPASPRMTP